MKMTTVSGVAMRTTLSEAGGGTGSSYGNHEPQTEVSDTGLR